MVGQFVTMNWYSCRYQCSNAPQFGEFRCLSGAPYCSEILQVSTTVVECIYLYVVPSFARSL